MFEPAALLKAHAASIDELLEREVPRGRDDFLSDGVWYQFGTGGKRLRPALCLLSCELLGGDPELARPFALATEILHNFLLIHDDIEDGDTIRRDQPTLWARDGIPNALNVADYLIARGYRFILESRLPAEVRLRLAEAYSFAFEKTVMGQALDINLRAAEDIDLATYYKIVTHKTAYYLAVTWVGGAIVAGVPQGDLEPFWELGECLGPAFQIRDDVLDLTEGKGRGGEVGCDIREGKPSVLFSYVMDGSCGNDEERAKLLEIFRRDREATTEEDIRWTIDFFERSGALGYADSEARRLVDRSDEVLARLPLEDEGREKFRAMARFIIDRKM